MLKRFVLIFLVLVGYQVLAQPALTDQHGNRIAPYYIDVNRGAIHPVDLRGEYLHLQYRDALGQAKTIPLFIYNWKNELVSSVELTKQFGLNQFDIKLADHKIVFNVNENYRLELFDEQGRKYEVMITYLPEVKNIITANIKVNPKYLECGDPMGANLIEFFGQVSGGKAPYQLNWYVMNDKRTDFLYQPIFQRIERDGYTSTIEVDKSPEYFVLMYVKDACQNEQTAVVQVTCSQEKKQINTVFFESIDNSVLNQINKSH